MAQISRACRKKMAPWPPRPVLVLVLLLALLCSHIALCSSADSGKPNSKATGGRKALVAAASVDDDDDGEDAPPVVKPAKKASPPAKKAASAAGKIKKRVDIDAKNQTTKAKKAESAAAAKGATKKASSKAGGDGAVSKAKLLEADKAKAKGTDSAKAAKVLKSSGAGKAAKSEAAAGAKAKAKKPTNLTADAGAAKPAKSGKKAQVVVEEEKASKDATLDVDEELLLGGEAEGSDDLISEFRGLPARLQETLMPDLARLSHQSKAYLSAANAGIADGVRPILGGRWAAAAATAASVALLLLPLCVLTALVRRAGAYLPLLHRALLLAQAYLAVYFATLAVAAAATGLEPLRFFRAASPATYAWTQAAQSLGFMAYLVLQMVDLVAVFSGAAAPQEDGEAARALGLAQMVVGLAVGLHYYAAVFHRAAAGEPPRANWRVYAVYAACFVIICACARAERRKKAYLAHGAAEEWKKS